MFKTYFILVNKKIKFKPECFVSFLGDVFNAKMRPKYEEIVLLSSFRALIFSYAAAVQRNPWKHNLCFVCKKLQTLFPDSAIIFIDSSHLAAIEAILQCCNSFGTTMGLSLSFPTFRSPCLPLSQCSRMATEIWKFEKGIFLNFDFFLLQLEVYIIILIIQPKKVFATNHLLLLFSTLEVAPFCLYSHFLLMQ